MQILLLYAITVVVFFVVDVVGLRFIVRPVFSRHIENLLLDDYRYGAAAAFYLFYVAGLVWFVSLPALRDGSPGQAFLGGAFLGAIAYGTYEFTNYATLRGWHWQMVATDLLWGAFLTGLAAMAGVAAMRAWG